MKNIAIYGAGGFGRETALLIQQINDRSAAWNMMGFYDDGKKIGESIDRLPVLGGIKELNQLTEPLNIVVSIADSDVRATVVKSITNSRINFPPVVHPTCLTGSRFNSISDGCILTAGTILTTGIKLGKFVIINLLTTVGHDVVCEDFVTIMPGCNISGNVKLGELSLVGTGARILQNLNIGSHCKIGAGAVVTRDFKARSTIVGIPANEK